MAQACPSFSVLRRRDVLLLPVAALAVALLPLPVTAAVPDFLTIIGNLVIPPTATPGAGNAAVVAFVTRAVSHGMDAAPADIIDVLAKALDARAGGTAILAATRTGSPSPTADSPPTKRGKSASLGRTTGITAKPK